MNILRVVILLIICISVQSCEDKIEKKDVEVTIIRTFTTGRSDPQGDSSNNSSYQKYANVRYTINNIDSDTITGWKIYFNVATDEGFQINIGGRYAGIVEPGETSAEKIAKDVMTAGTGNAVSATLKMVEAW